MISSIFRRGMSRAIRTPRAVPVRAISTSTPSGQDSESPLQWDMLNSCFMENGAAGFLFPYFVQTEMKLTNEGLRSIFDRIDTNGDGVLQRDEIMNGFQANGITFRAETVDAIMSLADKNNDGVIQYEEFEAMMENLWKTHNVDPANVGNW